MAITSVIEQVTSVEAVVSADDLLLEILSRLPVRSILRFKSVSKRWLSLITNPKFAHNHKKNHNPNPALGLFLPCAAAFRDNPKFKYINFDVQNPITPPFSKLEFVQDPAGIIILQSCNGLLLCSSFRAQELNRYYYVYNPTARQFLTLPKPGGSGNGASRIVYGISLALDPANSPHYKVILVRGSNLSPTYYQIEIYSSESGCWRISGDPFTADDINFQNGVYWNGSVHWISIQGIASPLYFNVDTERLKAFPLPAIPDNHGVGGTRIAFFGESCDHLHLILTHRYQSQFNVYELKRDYCKWFVKYRVDLTALSTAFPRIIQKQVRIVYNLQLRERGWNRSANLNPTDLCEYLFSVFALTRGEKEEDGFLVLQIPGHTFIHLESKHPQDVQDRIFFGSHPPRSSSSRLQKPAITVLLFMSATGPPNWCANFLGYQR